VPRRPDLGDRLCRAMWRVNAITLHDFSPLRKEFLAFEDAPVSKDDADRRKVSLAAGEKQSSHFTLTRLLRRQRQQPRTKTLASSA